jgi:hypothetical protein
MSIHMKFQFILAGESLLASVALERPFARVDTAMSFEMGRAGEWGRANVAAKRFLASVGTNVGSQLCSPFAILETERTNGLDYDTGATTSTLVGIGQHGKWILIGMNSFILFIIIFFVNSLL